MSLELGHGRAYAEKLGMSFDTSVPGQVIAEMPVEGNQQPDGFLHGGATMSLIESVASMAGALRAGWPENVVMGQQQTCNFLATVTQGRVRAIPQPVHVGRSTHVWDVEVTSVETGKKIAAGRVTLAVRPRRPDSSAS